MTPAQILAMEAQIRATNRRYFAYFKAKSALEKMKRVRNEMMAVWYGYVHEGPVSASLARLLLDTPQPEIQVEVCDN